MGKIKNSFLEYYKMILSKVSFDTTLLQREYLKAVETLQAAEVEILNLWMRKQGLIQLVAKG